MEFYWEKLRYYFSYNDVVMNVVGHIVLSNIVFWTTNLCLLFVDLTGRPKWILSYKIQEDKNIPVDRKLLPKVFKLATFNSLVTGSCLFVLLSYIQRYLGCPTAGAQLPNLLRMVLEFAVFTVIEEVGVYYTHRFFHYGPFYKRYHKTHHEWKAPIGLSAFYGHPLDHAMVVIVPIFLGPLLLRSHIATVWLWLAVDIANITINHSGYHLPFLKSPEFHDYHHLKFNQNYGTMGLLDWFHGTDKEFRKTVQYQRNRTLWGVTPISHLIPDRNTAE